MHTAGLMSGNCYTYHIFILIYIFFNSLIYFKLLTISKNTSDFVILESPKSKLHITVHIEKAPNTTLEIPLISGFHLLERNTC